MKLIAMSSKSKKTNVKQAEDRDQDAVTLTKAVVKLRQEIDECKKKQECNLKKLGNKNLINKLVEYADDPQKVKFIAKLLLERELKPKPKPQPRVAYTNDALRAFCSSF